MLFRLRATVAVIVVALLFSTAPAFGGVNGVDDRPHSVPVMVDVVVLRLLGLAALAIGAAGFAMFAPFVAMTRPKDFRGRSRRSS
jgi:hypothetical protein